MTCFSLTISPVLIRKWQLWYISILVSVLAVFYATFPDNGLANRFRITYNKASRALAIEFQKCDLLKRILSIKTKVTHISNRFAVRNTLNRSLRDHCLQIRFLLAVAGQKEVLDGISSWSREPLHGTPLHTRIRQSAGDLWHKKTEIHDLPRRIRSPEAAAGSYPKVPAAAGKSMNFLKMKAAAKCEGCSIKTKKTIAIIPRLYNLVSSGLTRIWYWCSHHWTQPTYEQFYQIVVNLRLN